jgi:hypothetical protein
MSYKIITRLTGSNVNQNVFNLLDSDHLQCRNLFEEYRANSWIESYTTEIIDSSTKQEIFLMDSSQRWDSYLSDINSRSKNKSISVFETTIVSKEEV